MAAGRRLVVAPEALQTVMASGVPLLLVGLVREKEAFVVGTVPAAGLSRKDLVEEVLPWPLEVVGWATTGPSETVPEQESLRLKASADGWTWDGAVAEPDSDVDWRASFRPVSPSLRVVVPQHDADGRLEALTEALGSSGARALSAAGAGPPGKDTGAWTSSPCLRAYIPVSGPSTSYASPVVAGPGTAAGGAATVELEPVAYAPVGAGQPELEQVALHALRRGLGAARSALTLLSERDVEVRVAAFSPPGWAAHVVPALALGSGEKEGSPAPVGRRRTLHELLGLPRNVPLLRLDQTAQFGAGHVKLSGGRLRDVHRLLHSPIGAGRCRHTVSGSYDYYHYLQDRTNDSGWGCAYRSLQTIWSWFQIASYTADPPPMHREVQAQLVKLGDKEPTFLGSRQWIGAIELGYVLDEALGVQCKILSVRSGDDIPDLAVGLARHFDEQGTPVMIGGGVLAYTLLGVELDEDGGDASFLILDPHYTGADDSKKVVSGGWVAWKKPGDRAAGGSELFVSKAHYNFLCPQRPRTC